MSATIQICHSQTYLKNLVFHSLQNFKLHAVNISSQHKYIICGFWSLALLVESYSYTKRVFSRHPCAWSPSEILREDSTKLRETLCLPHSNPNLTAIHFSFSYSALQTLSTNMLVVKKKKKTGNCLTQLTVYIKEKALKIYHSRDSINNLEVRRIWLVVSVACLFFLSFS